MCGICGIGLHLNNQESVNTSVLERMTRAMAHRGPDEERLFINPDRKIGFGFRRLSIIDLSTGSQPLANEDESLWVVFNGEIYNYQQLRCDLEDLGHVFRTNSDTETLLHAYEQYGLGFVEYLRGMFAFAIWDRQSQRLVLGRDRLGKKPLYYYQDALGIYFASEIKALLQNPQVPREIDMQSLADYLVYKYVPAPHSILAGVNKLPPAHYLVYDLATQSTNIQSYWQLDYKPKIHLDIDEAEERLLDILREAVRLRMISDVPLGALLSGGIDSSVIVALMAEQAHQVKTFTIGFDEDKFDERSHARTVAQHFGTQHHEFVVRAQMVDILPKMVYFLDEPMADSSALPTYCVSEIARQHVTVVLNGDGGDENFAGYWHYKASLAARQISMLPDWFLNGVIAPTASAAYYLTRNPFFSRLHSSVLESEQTIRIKHENRVRLHTDNLLSALMPGFGKTNRNAFFKQFHDSLPDLDPVDAMLCVDINTFLPGQLLVKMDRMSMAHSLEARSPLLDQEVMAFSAQLPVSFKMANGRQKLLLRRLSRRFIPEALAKRPKQGFAVPVERWLYQENAKMVQDILLNPKAAIYDYLDQSVVINLLNCPRSHRQGNSNVIWALLVLEIWIHEVLIK